jgi:hypothetical protein
MMRAAAIVAILGTVAYAAVQVPATRAVATTGEVMTALVVPSSNAVFRTTAEPPQADADWTAVHAQALLLAEAGNLLLIGTRVRDQAEWARAAAALRDTAEAFAKAAAAKDAARLEALSENVYETCEQCHSRYLSTP